MAGLRVRDGDDDEQDEVLEGEWLDESDHEAFVDRDLGPDERDADLMDGTWEQRYYSGQERQRDWSGVYLGIALLIVMAFILPMLLVFAR
jgi:hypothetical protein